MSQPSQVPSLLYRSPRIFRWGLTWFGPYWGTGIRVTHVAPDFSRVEVEMRPRWFNRNAFGTHFGGSLYSMCDPFFCLMLIARLGRGYWLWDQAAQITFIQPARGTVRATFTWSQEQIEAIEQAAASGEKIFPEREVEIIDASGAVVARVHKTLYVRKKKPAA